MSTVKKNEFERIEAGEIELGKEARLRKRKNKTPNSSIQGQEEGKWSKMVRVNYEI